MTKSGKLGNAYYEIQIEANGAASVRVWHDYATGVFPTTARRVWEIVANFGGIKTIFPSVLSVYLTYPDDTTAEINTVRYMTFAPANAGSPLSPTNPLSLGVEKLMALDEKARQLTYISVLGMQVENYQSTMAVTGDDACTLTWTSTFTVPASQESFVEILANILAGGTNQIATALGLE